MDLLPGKQTPHSIFQKCFCLGYLTLDIIDFPLNAAREAQKFCFLLFVSFIFEDHRPDEYKRSLGYSPFCSVSPEKL